MTLATDLSAFVYGVDLAALEPRVIADAKTLIVDALACIIAGAESEGARIARAAAPEHASDNKQATVLIDGLRTSTASAALINGAMLRALDLMDVYVGRDVCHPSEIIPVALTCADAGGASGKTFLEAVVAGLALHMQIADFIPLHRHGLHHVGQAAWTVPLIAARLLGHDKTVAARALTVAAHGMIVPESFSLGQLTNLKALAYPLIARQSIDAVRLAAAGLTGAPAACEEVVKLLAHRFGMDIPLHDLVPATAPDDVSVISLKIYPAQYALQPLISTAGTIRASDPTLLDQTERIIVRASWRTVERCADPAKYVPRSAEAADHSLPFCVAIALLEGGLTTAALAKGRWKDDDVLALMSRIKARPMSDDQGYHVGAQDITLQMKDGKYRTFPCRYPPENVTWAKIAEQKLNEVAMRKFDAEKILEIVSTIETQPSLERLIAAMTRAQAGAAAPSSEPPAANAAQKKSA